MKHLVEHMGSLPRLASDEQHWEGRFTALIANPSRRLLVYFVAHRLSGRVAQSDCEDLQRLYADFVYENAIGGSPSFTAEIPAQRRLKADVRLAELLIAAVDDVSPRAAGAGGYLLRHLSQALNEAWL